MPAPTPGEVAMWTKPIRTLPPQSTDQEINDKYDRREGRIVTEANREKLPNFVESLKKSGYMDTQPFYQRRLRWDAERQSRLVESFIINIPVPPLFVYEVSYNKYEVMDGQQRIEALKAFYDNRLELEGLQLWPELNGRTYATLPSNIRAGIDRRSISYIVLLKESAEEGEEATLLKQHVFERLNTGGIKLTRQEVRNCLNQGLLNNLVLRLSRTPAFANAWGIPPFTEAELTQIPSDLADNDSFRDMEDAELVLRFFALRHVDHFAGGMQNFLDLFMVRSASLGPDDLTSLEALFLETLELASGIYGANLFRPYDTSKSKFAKRAQKAWYDAVMVGLSDFVIKGNVLLSKKDAILEKTIALFLTNEPGTFTGRGNSKSDIAQRIKKFRTMIEGFAS